MSSSILNAGAAEEVISKTGSRYMIRQATEQDRAQMFHVCLRTGNSGQDATSLYVDKNILGDRWISPYLLLEPSLAFVLVDSDHGGEIVGYSLGCLNTKRFEERLFTDFLPAMQATYPLCTAIDSDIIRNSNDEKVKREFYDYHTTPDDIVDASKYESHMHINIISECQGLGLGRPLIQHMIAGLRHCNSCGLFLEMSGRNSNAFGFYQAMGFHLLSTVIDPATSCNITACHGSSEEAADSDSSVSYLCMKFEEI
jgi:ribosomal protein S18 acetylase RimI-like enzyme